MSFINPKYPNIELLIYKAKERLAKDKEFMDKIKQLKKNQYFQTEFDVIVFPQIWGSTCTGFDVMEDGSPAIGGSTITKEYTTVIHEISTDTWIVFFGDRICYKVTNANARFYSDLSERNMVGLNEAMKTY